MLNQKSLPVWMLADALIVLSVGGGVLALMLASPFLQDAGEVIDYAKMKLDLAAAQESQAATESKSDDLQKQLLTSQHERDQLQATKRELTEYQNAASKWINNAETRLAQFEQAEDSEKSLRQELLNLRGDFSRVVFVIDISGSMADESASRLRRPNWGDDGKPWTYVKNQVNSWLKNLPVESFRLVVFNQDLREFPVGHENWIRGDARRIEAAEFLDSCQPEGGTSTELAIRRALEHQPTAIVLFTDGAPSKIHPVDKNNYVLDPDQMESILQMLAIHGSEVPVNVVAVSNYFDNQLATFLQEIAAQTGGGFVGL